MKWKGRIAFWIPLALLITAVLVVCLPLLRPGFFVSDDGGWMVIRLSAFYQSLREGQFPVRFLGRLNFGYGYPVANFLYPGFMYIGSFIHLLGPSFVDTVKIIFGGSVAIGTVFTFLWLRKYFNQVASLVGTLGFTFAPYLLFDLYHRGSVGEVLALGWGAMGLYSIAAKKRWLFGLTIPLIILAHNSLAFLFLGFFALYITLLQQWREYFLMFGAGVGMASFFWLPALYERKYVIFDSVAVANPKEYFISVGNAALLGISGILAGALALLQKRMLQKEKFFFVAIITVAVLLATSISTRVWEVPLLIHIIQFPYRLLSVAIFAGAWLMAYATQSTKRLIQPALIILLVGVGLWGVIAATQSVIHIQYPEGYYSTNEATTNVADEYMPIWVSKKPTVRAGQQLVFYKGGGQIVVSKVTTQMIDVVVRATEPSVIQINTLYYPGWGATVDDTQIRLDYTSGEGVMRVIIPPGDHHLVVAFRETISRFLADIVSLVSFIGYMVLVIVGRTRARKKK